MPLCTPPCALLHNLARCKPNSSARAQRNKLHTIHNPMGLQLTMRLDRVFRPTQYLALRGSTEAEQQAVPDSKSEGLDHEDADVLTDTKHRRRLLHSVSLLWLNLAFFLVSSAMFILSLKPSQPLYRDQMPEQERNHYLKHVSMPCKFIKDTQICAIRFETQPMTKKITTHSR